MTILGLAESFETLNRPDSTRPGLARPELSLTAYFSERIRNTEVKFCYNLHSSLQLVLLKFWINIIESLKYYLLFSNVAILVIFSSFFIITFD